ncbi:dicarboxylate/amino acid:cation symporter [Isoptericola sp. NEAU-Y5]|uniref:Dicarboxylate/amino acid:cation symporter n=1 Tax=Isoptericola luteus TaxID=2879484 RepID=A0ABS7Z9N3_9MICO|nr:dicarboxylate/amino acid:cation symporter [Isoptericola sp. NEAU-Y5]MCA5891766.1 dicarboxylate/amino acid:cation symporter [Isoptericola sp. NEAU-Y5]MCA5894599.1 dicarboxylate/amino acid:cation symporter [Isoptericola sp. NEAU-Y5]
MPGTSARARGLRLPSFSVQILLGLVLGVLLGWAALALGPQADGETPNGLTTTLDTIGSSFVTLLKAIVPPLIFTAIVASIANLRTVTNAARLAGQTLLWFAITAAISVAIGIGLGLVFQPGNTTTLTTADAAEPSRTGTWLDFLNGLIPSNVLGLGASTSVEAGADGALSAETGVSFNVLQILVVALVIGIAALKSGAKADPFLAFNRSALAIVQKVLWWIIRLAPLGTMGLIGYAVATYGWESLRSLASFAAAVYVGLALVLFVVYPVLLRVNGLSVLSWFRGAWPAIQLAFVSRSSIGTLPVTERVTERNLGVPSEYASFAVPLGATTKMDGCASIYPAISAIFVAQIFGVDLSVTDYLLIAFVSVVGSAATAGLTGAMVMLTLTLSTLGLPLAGVGLLLAVDPILDMGRTAVNVAGQTLVPTIVAKREGILDLERFRAASAEHLFADDEPESADAAEAPAERELAEATARG